MKQIRAKAYRFIWAAVCGGAGCGLVYVFFPDHILFRIFFLFLLAGLTLASLALAFLKFRILREARLILENKLLTVRFAAVERGADVSSAGGGVEVVVSCFGILLDSRVISFNRKANRLRRVEIGRNSSAFFYGAGAQTGRTTILHEPLSGEAALRLAESFRFETGAETLLSGKDF